MNIDQIKLAKDAVPFRPFHIRTADGETRTVAHPDAIAWDPTRPYVVHCVEPGGRWEYIDLAPVTSLSVEAPESRLEPRRP